MVTDNNTMQAILNDAFILLYDGRLSAVKDLLPVLERVSSDNKALLVVAEDIDGEALSTLIVNKMRGILKVAAFISGQSMNIAGNASTATLATKASTLSQGGGNGTAMTFNWAGQGGQPAWLWGSNDGVNHYVWNPSNFNVNYANTAGTAFNITQYTVNQNVGTANSPTFAGLTSTGRISGSGASYRFVLPVGANYWAT